MPHKIEINTEDGSIKLDGVDISATVADWSLSFSQTNFQMSGNKSAYAMIFRRFVYDGDKQLSDDNGIMTYTQVFNDFEITLKVDGKIRRVAIPPVGMKLVKPK